MVDVALYFPSLCYFSVGVEYVADVTLNKKFLYFFCKALDGKRVRLCEPRDKIKDIM